MRRATPTTSTSPSECPHGTGQRHTELISVVAALPTTMRRVTSDPPVRLVKTQHSAAVLAVLLAVTPPAAAFGAQSGSSLSVAMARSRALFSFEALLAIWRGVARRVAELVRGSVRRGRTELVRTRDFSFSATLPRPLSA